MNRRLRKVGYIVFMLAIFLCPISALVAEEWRNWKTHMTSTVSKM